MKFSLECNSGHTFEGWFKSNTDYETQQKRGFLACPMCGSSKVGKTLMAPAVSTGRSKEKTQVAMSNAAQAEIMAKMMQLARDVKATADDVGEKFPEEARKMHYGETDPKPIYGKASNDEVTELLDEGVQLIPLPDVPDDSELN